MNNKKFNDNELIINPFSIKIISKDEYLDIAKKNKEIREKEGVFYVDSKTEKDNGLEQIGYSYNHEKLYSCIYTNYILKIHNIIYFLQDIGNGIKKQKINTGWDKFILFQDDGFYDKGFNLCGYFNIISRGFSKKLDELDYAFNELRFSIKNINYENDGKNIRISDIHKFGSYYNIFIANILSVYEYLDLFIILEYLFFEKNYGGKDLKNNKIQVRVSREQRLKPYLDKNNLEELFNFYEKLKNERDFLLHKGNSSFRFLKDDKNIIHVKIGNDFVIEKIEKYYKDIEKNLALFYENYINKFN